MRMPPAASIASRILPSARWWSAFSCALIVSSTCAWPVPRPCSQLDGSLGPTSPRSLARAAIPSLNSREKLSTTFSETPSARRPAAVTATFSVVRGLFSLPGFHGSAVVTWSSSPENHARACSGGQSSCTNA